MTLKDLKTLVEHQADDEELWVYAETTLEAYLQQELRRLHGMIEAVIKDKLREVF